MKSFLPDLVKAISDCVQPVSDQCLAKGLIPDSVYKRVLESGGTSDERTSNLILAVRMSTQTDSRCFGIFLDILEQVLPHGIKDVLLSAMKKELTEQTKGSTCMSMVAVSGQNFQLAPITPLTSGEVVKLQISLFGKLEDAIRQHEHACAEKKMLEDNVKAIEEENEKLKHELNSLKQNQAKDNTVNKLIESTERRISACEDEMSELQKRIKKLESIIEEQSMQVKRGRDGIGTGVVNLMDQLSKQAQREITEVKQESEKKEMELLAALKEKEENLLAAQKEVKEKEYALKEVKQEGEKKEAEYMVALQEKDKELLAAQERSKEQEQHNLETLEKAKQKEADLSKALQEKQKELLEAQNEGKEKEQCS